MDLDANVWILIGCVVFGAGSIIAYQAFWWEKSPAGGTAGIAVAVLGFMLCVWRGGLPDNAIYEAKDLDSGSRWEKITQPRIFEIRNIDDGSRVLFRGDTNLKEFQIDSEWGTGQWELRKAWKFTEHTIGPIQPKPPED